VALWLNPPQTKLSCVLAKPLFEAYKHTTHVALVATIVHIHLDYGLYEHVLQ
jgi:hypothetical protein